MCSAALPQRPLDGMSELLRHRVQDSRSGEAKPTGPRWLSWVQVATYGLEHVRWGDAEVTLVALTGDLDVTNVDDLDAQLAALANGLPLVAG